MTWTVTEKQCWYTDGRNVPVAALLSAVCVLTSPARADDRADARALGVIIGEDVLAANTAAVLQRTQSPDAESRFRRLANWVLPSKEHAEFRLTGEFSPSCPLSMPAAVGSAGNDPVTDNSAVDNPADLKRLQTAGEHGIRRVQTGGFPVSPALELVCAAKEAGLLEELRDRTALQQPKDEVNQRCRIALLGMTEIAREDFDAALIFLDEMDARHRNSTFADLADRWPETLLLSVAVEHRPLHDAAETLLQRIVTNQVRAGHHSGPAVWDQQMYSLAGRLRYLQLAERRSANASAGSFRKPSKTFGLPPEMTHWMPIAEGDEATFAQGFPVSHWQQQGTTIEKLSGHRDEYLCLRSPLTGDYEIECDITGFGYREGQLVVGGHWNWLHYTHTSFETGDLRGTTGTVDLQPKLSLVNDWVHYRTVVRNGVCHSCLNGRLLTSETLRESQYPWPMIRSPFWASTSVRDIRITGTPQIPDHVSMSTDPQLSGWVRYHLDTVGGSEGDWRFDPSIEPNGGIFARRKSEFQGMFQESLLRYFRPMIEDGIIEYEFEHIPGQSSVAPALGRLAFLPEPEGMKLHRITDGVWDRSGIDPLNLSTPASSTSCPLQSGWNQLKLNVTADTLTIAVNDAVVLQTEIDRTNSRTFGLFHFADQSQVRVRNMRWSGHWPKTLPPLRDQELRDRTLDDVDDRSASLAGSIVLDFAGGTTTLTQKGSPYNGLSLPLTFSCVQQSSDGAGSVTIGEGGMLMVRPASVRFHDIKSLVNCGVVGDFDVVAEFTDLRVETPADGNSAIYLVVVADDDLMTHSRVWHGVYAHPQIDRRRVSQVEFNRFRPGASEIQFDGVTAEATDSGRLRISRVGRKMYFMVSEQDSPSWRLIHSADTSDVPLRPNGVRLAAGTYDNQSIPAGGVNVKWKKLTIRADQLRPFSALQFRTNTN
ncbi:MAG: DUF1583 domain-containing protein [Planctomycetaceae bacterium]|nr:DUF1583 domain-containing protein [Planctomycetaceae bacterium]